MKIGVYGGTFNPIHLGHVHILREFIARLKLDKVLLIPAGTPPHKAASELAPGEDRAAMCTLAAQAAGMEDVVEVSHIELDRPGKSYTADTLGTLRQLYPQDELFLLMGEDMFLTVDKWYRPEKIFRLAALCASPRSQDGWEELLSQQKRLEALGARCFVEDIPFVDVSSTQIRQLAGDGASLAGLVAEPVAGYMEEHQLYQGGLDHGL